MATEFLRLYKELCAGTRVETDSGAMVKQSRSQGNEGDMYPAVRLSVMAQLGFDVGLACPIRTQPSKHHGKQARRSKEIKAMISGPGGNSSTKNVTSTRDEAAKKKHLNDIMQETERINKVAREIEAMTTLGKPINNDLVLKLANETKKRTAANIVNRFGKLPPLSTVTTAREPSVIRKDFSGNKWSQEELEKMNSLFHEIPKPSTKHLDAWYHYYKNLAARFRSLYGHRSEQSVIEKFQCVILKRQLKESGERTFWKELHSVKAADNQDTKPTFTKSSRF